MGVMNITPDSFSDGGELNTPAKIIERLQLFKNIECIDIGAESTAPMNESISWEEEWERLKVHLLLFKDFPGTLSFDTYHPETMEEILRFYLDHGFTQELIWNDVSGKFDSYVRDFLSIGPHFHYVYCHNLAPNRELTGRHMDYIDPHLTLESLKDYFAPFAIPQVILDPCLGFSKSYEQNWMLLENFHKLQELIPHERWMLGFSRKSFLRKKFGLDVRQVERLDETHVSILERIVPILRGEVWIRTHRPEILSVTP